MRIIEYTVVAALSFEKMIELINKRIVEGWQPQGGICYNMNMDGLIQALVKYEESK